MLEKLGRYQISEELGRGAMGVVYLGFDPTIGRTVAIKTIHLDSRDPELLARFRNEAQAAGVLSHANIVTIYDAGQDQGVFYIAMEYVPGETLQARLTRGPIPFNEALRITDQIGAALDHAHARRVIHRDVKPANVMLSPEGSAKVMDFGVAKLSTVNMTATGQIFGTPAYLSPEAVRGRPIDGRSDIFSLGVMLYEMLFGSKPFKGDDVTAVIYKILETEPEVPPGFKELVHPGLEYVLNKVLEKNPDERYQTCSALLTDLKNCHTPQFKARIAAVPARAPRTERTMVLDSKTAQPRRTFPAPPLQAPLPLPPSRDSGLWSLRPRFILIVAALAAAVGAATTWGLNRLVSHDSPVPPTALAQQSIPAPAKPEATPSPAARKAAAVTTPDDASKLEATKRLAGEMIQVVLTSNAAGASIFVDGETRPEWVTPQRLFLKPERHRIELRKPGYKSQTQTILFNKDGRKHFELEPLPVPNPSSTVTSIPEAVPQTPAVNAGLTGRVQVLTEPAGARILIDGQRTNYSSPVNFQIPAGAHQITIEHRCCEPVIRDIVVQPNQILPFRIELKRK